MEKVHCFICGTDNCYQGSGRETDMARVCIACDLLIQQDLKPEYQTNQGVINLNGNGFPYFEGSHWKGSIDRVKARYQQAPKQLSEKPCKQCRKPNDVGVRQCWWCTCPSPTA